MEECFQYGDFVTNKYELGAKTLVLGKASLCYCWMTEHIIPQRSCGRHAVLTQTKNAMYTTECCLRLPATQIATVTPRQYMKSLHELSDFQSLPAMAVHT